MRNQFDPGPIKAQIDSLKVDRDRIDHAIQALETALRSIQARDGTQRQFTFNGSDTSDITLLEAVKRVCTALKDAITKSRVIREIESQFPLVKPKPSSVSAALIKLSRGEQPMLKVALEG